VMHTRAVKLSVLVEEYASLPLRLRCSCVIASVIRKPTQLLRNLTIFRSARFVAGSIALGPRSQDFVLCPTEALIMAAGRRGPLLHARVAMLRAMNHGRGGCSGRIATHWGKLKREE
jgi:hypothetical protein